MFNPSFSFLDNGMSAHSAFEPTHQGSNTRNQLQVPRQAFSPFTQQTYPHSYARPQDRHQGSYPSSPPWQLHSRQHQHALPQYGNHYTFGGDRHQPFALGHALQEKTTAETKARLDKKHVEILEQEFQRNQKPSSIIKRELAEQMGHEIARINVRTQHPEHHVCFVSLLTRPLELVPEQASQGEVQQEDGRVCGKGGDPAVWLQRRSIVGSPLPRPS